MFAGFFKASQPVNNVHRCVIKLQQLWFLLRLTWCLFLCTWLVALSSDCWLAYHFVAKIALASYQFWALEACCDSLNSRKQMWASGSTGKMCDAWGDFSRTSWFQKGPRILSNFCFFRNDETTGAHPGHTPPKKKQIRTTNSRREIPGTRAKRFDIWMQTPKLKLPTQDPPQKNSVRWTIPGWKKNITPLQPQKKAFFLFFKGNVWKFQGFA